MASFGYTTIAAFYAATLVLSRLIWILWKGFTGPLRSIPGPWYTKLTNSRLKWAVLSGRRMYHIHSLHEKYGAIVRISPDEVSVADFASYKEIYRIGSGFIKSDWYSAVAETDNEPRSIFNTIDPKAHAIRRRLLAKGFSQRLLRQNWESVVRERVSHALGRIREEAAVQGTADVLKWWTFMTADVASKILWGESFGMLELGYKVPFVDALQNGLLQMTLRWEVPGLYRFLRFLRIPALRPIMDASSRLQDQGSMAVHECKARGIVPNTLFATMINDSEKEGTYLTDEDLRVEAGNFIVAGSDTTSHTLTYLVWVILRDAKLRKLVVEEMDILTEMTDEALEKLPILNAIIEETLRLYGAVPATLPRRTPHGGITLHGHFIPEGTTVGTQAYSMHRDPKMFPEPFKFDHTRFLPTTPLSDMAKASLGTFGGGATNCLGVHLARMELRVAVALFFTELRSARLAPSTTDKSMEMENFFLITPKSHRCDISL